MKRFISGENTGHVVPRGILYAHAQRKLTSRLHFTHIHNEPADSKEI